MVPPRYYCLVWNYFPYKTISVEALIFNTKGVENYLDFRMVLPEDHPTLVGWNPLGNTTILKSRAMASVVFMKVDVTKVVEDPMVSTFIKTALAIATTK